MHVLSEQACPFAPELVTHPHPERTSAPTRLRAPVPVATVCRSTPRPTHPHAGSDPLDQHAPSACSAPNRSPTIRPRTHGLPLLTILPAGCAATSLVEPTGSTNTES